MVDKNKLLLYYSNTMVKKLKFVLIFMLLINSGVYGLNFSARLNYLLKAITVLDQKIELNDLFYLKKDELRIIRNAIYAKYGYIFQSKDLTDFFLQFEWYNATKNNVDDLLNNIDIQNISLITAVEINYPNDNELIIKPDQMPKRYYVFTHYGIDHYLSGLWVFSHFDNNIRTVLEIDFCFNGIYTYSWNNYHENKKEWEKIEYVTGLWSIHNGILEMTPFPNIPSVIDRSRFLELNYFISIFEVSQSGDK